ncbi:iron ABC transporter permease [Bacillus zhangzhouensis]|nr:iron ABC transporter permease [Bacillus zhangzhouensis]
MTSRAKHVRQSKNGYQLVCLLGFLILGMFLSISIGTMKNDIWDIIRSLYILDGSKLQLTVWTIRLPRTIAAILIGAHLAVAGALMQSLTKNPLASPQIFGVNAGATLAVCVSIIILPGYHFQTVWVALLGAAVGASLVFIIGSKGGITPTKLALTGMAVHLFLSSITQGLVITNQSAGDLVFWMAGSISSSNWADVRTIFPFSLLCLTTTFLLSRSIYILGFGDEAAKGLGENVIRMKVVISLLVLFLAGSAVAISGPIGFVGLMVPHLVKKLFEENNKWLIPLSAVAGATLLLYADIVARLISFPYESPVGIVTAMIGAPFFIHLMRREGMKNAEQEA